MRRCGELQHTGAYLPATWCGRGTGDTIHTVHRKSGTKRVTIQVRRTGQEETLHSHLVSAGASHLYRHKNFNMEVTMSRQEAREALIDKIAALPAQIADLVHKLSAEEVTTAHIPGEWTVAQNVHHLADSHMNSYIRCKLIATEETPTLKPYDQDEWARFPDARNADVTASLGLLTALHQRWVVFWRALGDDDWQRTGFHPENGMISLDDQLIHYADHGEAHIDQIQRTLVAGGITD